MKLTRIEIENFRCFEKLSAPLQPDVNVFVGVNGAGKTAILDAVAIALSNIVAGPLHSDEWKRIKEDQGADLRPADIYIAPGFRDPVIGRRERAEVTAWAGDYQELPGFPAKTPDGHPNIFEWAENISYQPPHTFLSGTRTGVGQNFFRYFEALWRDVRGSGAGGPILLPVFAYYRASRRMTPMPPLENLFAAEGREAAFLNALDAGADYQEMCKWFYLRENQELRERFHGNGDSGSEFPDLKAVRQALALSLVNVSRIFFDHNPPRLKIEFAGSGDAVPLTLELEQLSDGYRNLLALILDFARRLAQANP
ncbi:MAG: AAA family ATPase, partial [Blastocatellia bacterium]